MIKNSKVQWIIVSLLLLVPAMIFYAIENPDSWIAYALFIEPSYNKIKFGYPMMENFRSYTSVENVSTDLKYEYGDFKGVSQTLSDGTEKPPYELYTLEVAGYVYLDHTGLLSLIFFNDRLCSLIFYPDNPDSFKDALIKESHYELRLFKPIQVEPHIELEYDKDPAKRIFFRWEDRRLIAEQRAWIMRHS